VTGAADDWWRTAVVYQVYPRSFADSDGDGVGDLRGIIGRLDHLAYLGIDVIWLSPVFRSPHDDNGYDISDYQAIDPAFGTLEDLDELIAAAHARGIRIVLDLVLNHTSDEHPWFIESASGRDSAKRDWYWWRPPREGHVGGEPGAEPNNWGSFFSGSAWQWDPASGEYYLHLFSTKQPDLNWENPEVRASIHRMLNWWLDRGVDGFRLDVINFISKPLDLPDGPPRGDGWGDGVPLYGYGPRIHEFLQELHAEVFEGRGRHILSIGEMPGVMPEQARRFTDPARRELDMVFQFDHVGLDHGPRGKWEHRPLDLPALKRTFARWQDALADTGWNSLYWSNHDQPRVVSRFGDDGEHRVRSATALATVLHLQRGTPFVYQGEELGMTNAAFGAIEDFRDIESLNHFAHAAKVIGTDAVLAGLRRMSRDNARTPMQWDDSRHGGFTAGTPWIAVNANTSTINAASQRGRAGSVLEFYRDLIALRHREPLVVTGRFGLLAPEHPSLFAFERAGEDRRLLVLANLASSSIGRDELAALVPQLDGRVLLANHPDPDPQDGLRPWEAVVLEQRRGRDTPAAG